MKQFEGEKAEKIIHAYGKVLEEVSKFDSKKEIYRMLHPESLLPYPKNEIRNSLITALTLAKEEGRKQQVEYLQIGLICLDDFIPDKKVPEDYLENIKR